MRYHLYGADQKLTERRIVNFQKIIDFSYADDGTKFVMSAVQEGQTDIFVFTAASNAFEQITHDVYDDICPRFIDHSNKIIFSSNRPDDTLKMGGDFHKMQNHYDIFEYNYATHSNSLRRITNTPDVDETSPMEYGNNYVSYLSNENGIVNRYIASVDSTISFVDTAAHYRYVVHSFPVTDYARNIVEQDITNNLKNYTQIIYYKGKYLMYDDTLSSGPGSFTPNLLYNTTFMAGMIAARKKKMLDDSLAAIVKKDTSTALIIKLAPITFIQSPAITPTPKDTAPKKLTDTLKVNPAHTPVDINDYSFDNSAPTQLKITVIQTPTVTQVQPQPIRIVNAVPKDTAKHDTSHGRKHVLERNNYHVSFLPDYVLTQIDNNFLNQTYQPYIAVNGPSYQQPSVGAHLKVSLSDLFEDYRIEGDARIAIDLSTNEYRFAYSDLSKRLDKQIILYREALLGINDNGYTIKTYAHQATYLLKWPFSEVARVEGSASVMEEKTVLMSSDLNSLEQPNQYDILPKAEFAYVYDATIPVEMNIYYGLRAKVFAQYFRDLGGPNNNVPGYNMFVLGFDARYYQKISRDLIWANRISGGTSLGQEKLLYYLGGVDGWIGPQFDQNINVSQTENYGFQTLAVPLRGSPENIRNGNNFVLFNSELRFPVFHYLINRPIKSDFFNNFQVVGFFDAGTAWTGLTPYSNDNALNETVVSAPGNPITVTLSTLQDPFVEGFGYGLRTRVLGYFIRFDDAWGINNGTIAKKPTTYFSLSLDF